MFSHAFHSEAAIIIAAHQRIYTAYGKRKLDMGKVNGTFYSVWDDGNSVVSAPCKVDFDNMEVTDIKTVDVSDAVNSLDYEYVEVDGIEYSVASKDTVEEFDGGIKEAEAELDTKRNGLLVY